VERGGKMPGYKDLEVYQGAYQLALEIHRQTMEKYPRHEQMELAAQIRRASKSIAFNIAEGYGKMKSSKQEFIRFLYMAMGSADEVAVQLEFSKDLEYVSEAEYAKLADQCDKIGRQIRRLIESQQ
jgi:four helix bundle protein